MDKKTKIDWGRFWFFLFWVAFNPTWQIMQGDFQALQKDGQGSQRAHLAIGDPMSANRQKWEIFNFPILVVLGLRGRTPYASLDLNEIQIVSAHFMKQPQSSLAFSPITAID